MTKQVSHAPARTWKHQPGVREIETNDIRRHKIGSARLSMISFIWVFEAVADETLISTTL